MIQSIKNLGHYLLAEAANIWFGFPSSSMVVIGVTGTDGKTTTASLIYHLLQTGGEKAALISTVGAYIAGKKYDIGFHVTTPSSWQLQKYIKIAKKNGVKYLVLEITSHALDQNRAAGIHINIAVLTNITQEHLDYHKTFERYRDAKLKLFKKAQICILNRDDPSFDYLAKKLSKKTITSYSLENNLAQFTIKNFSFRTKLLGTFNILNSLAAAAAAQLAGVSVADIKRGLASFKSPPGRLQIVYNDRFKVIIDFAHTPNALASILPEIKKKTNGRLIHVFGAAGERDKSKRPEMGRVAAESDDIIILTAEDPRSESVENITEALASGIKSSEFIFQNQVTKREIQNNRKYVLKIPDRKQAIDFAVSIAAKGDTVLLTGKGPEKSMNYGHGEEPWDEEKVAFVAIQKHE